VHLKKITIGGNLLQLHEFKVLNKNKNQKKIWSNKDITSTQTENSRVYHRP